MYLLTIMHAVRKKTVLSSSTVLLLTILISVSKIVFLDKAPFFGDEALYCHLGYNFTQQSFVSALNTTVFLLLC